jgi:hypothetical protein
MMAEKRKTYTAEFKREAVRLVTEHHYGWRKQPGIWGSIPTCYAAGNASLPTMNMVPSQGKADSRPSRKNSTACAPKISAYAWNVRF